MSNFPEIDTQAVFARIHELGVVPIVTIDSLEAALPLADALIAGGLPVAEITFRTAIAADVIRLLARERPQLLIGAGTVLTLDNLRAARECGAQFAVAPGLNPQVIAEAQRVGLPMIPGVATASEIEHGLALGCQAAIWSSFPAALLGGPALLSLLAGPFAHTGLRFFPSGGMTAENLADYLAAPLVSAVGGTWLARKEDFAAGRWDEISARCRVSRQTVAQVRGA